VPVATRPTRRSGSTGTHPRNAADRRRLIVSVLLAGSLVIGFASMAGVACSSSEQAPVGQHASAAPAVHHGRQAEADVQTVADALAKSSETTYTAVYTTAGGQAVSVAQSPPLHAYRGQSASYILSPNDAYLCPASGKCRHLPGDDSLTPSQLRSIGEAFGDTFIPAEAAVARMQAVVAEPDARTGRATQQIAGAGADCVAVTGSVSLTGCVNEAGVLVYYAGTSEGGKPVRYQLTSFSETVATDAFTAPSS
jgi:hypothetical protein